MPGREATTRLVRAAQDGDDLSFAELVRSYQDFAVAYAASILDDYHLAEDAAQEAFVEAHRELPALRHAEAFAGWLRSIVFKHCDRMTRRKRLPAIRFDDTMDVASQEPSPRDVLESREAKAAVREAIAALPDTERAVVLLYYMAEHSHTAIAAFLGVTANTVKTRLYSARRRLRMQMGDLEKSAQGARPSSDPQFARRVMTAALPLQLRFLDGNGDSQAAGSTIASRAVETPASPTWFIEPARILTDKDWDTVIGLMKELAIPGLNAAGQITDSLLERISRLDHITYLCLSGSEHLTDAGLQKLARLPRLEHLDVSCPAITDGGLEILRHLPNLKTFRMYHQRQVSDAGFAHLKHCRRLERVDLMGTRAGDGAILTLTGIVQLREFLAGSGVTDAGLALLHQFPVFKNWSGGEPRFSLMRFGAHPNYLWLNLKSSLTDAGLSNLKGLDGLYALNLFGGNGPGPFDCSDSRITPAGLNSLKELAQLSWLGCNARLCTDEAMNLIGAMPRIRFLMCQDTVAGDDGFAALSRSGSVEYIWGRRCFNLSGRGFAALATMPALRGLAVSCRNVDDVGLSALPRFAALDEFMPMDVPDEGFRHVGGCEKLESLYCMYCRETTDAATEHISGLSRLKTYGAWSTRITNRSLEILGGMPSLESIRFYQCSGITDAGLNSLVALPRLREVGLEGLANVTAEAAAVFPVHVRVNIEG